MRKIIISFWVGGLTCFALAFGIIIYLLLPLSSAKKVQSPHALDQLVLSSPSDPVVYYRRGVAHLAEHQLELAQKDFLKSLDLKPAQPDVFYHLSLVAIQRQHWHEALKYLNQTLHLSPKHTRALLNRGYVYASLGQMSLARLDLQAALQHENTGSDPYESLAYQCQIQPKPHLLNDFPAHPADENILRAKAYCAARVGKSTEAFLMYQTLWYRYAHLKDYFGMARAQYALGDLSQARYILEKITWADPYFQPAQTMLAQTLFSQREHERLKTMLDKLPANMSLTSILRLRYAPNKQHFEQVNKLLKSEPWHGNAYFAISQYYFQEGDMNQALNAAEQAWQKHSGDLEYGRFLWELYMQNNQRQKAEKLKLALMQVAPEMVLEF